jgi:hypothetical protein
MRRRLLRTLPLILATFVVIGMSLLAYESLTMVLGGFLLVMMATLATLLADICSGKSVFSRRKWSRKSWQLVGIYLAVCLSVWMTDWPLRIAFALSRPTLERAAQELKVGKPVPSPRFIGLFYIWRAELNGKGQPCFWTALDSTGPAGFVLAPFGDPHYNLWSKVTLSNDWYLIKED